MTKKNNNNNKQTNKQKQKQTKKTKNVLHHARFDTGIREKCL